MRGLGAIAGAALLAVSAIPQNRIYGAENIRRHLQRQKRDARGASGSLAGLPHKHEREIARRLRQAERDGTRQRDRYLSLFSPEQSPPEYVGLSRRGRLLFA